jgi:hypothetical protein
MVTIKLVNGKVEINDFVKIHETANAILIKIENKDYWFKIKSIIIEKNKITLDKDVYKETMKNPVVKPTSKIFCKNGFYFLKGEEEAKTYKLIIHIKSGEYEAEKFIFIPKTFVKESNENYIIVEKWIWDKALSELLDKEVIYNNDKFPDYLKTTNDYEILEEIEE